MLAPSTAIRTPMAFKGTASQVEVNITYQTKWQHFMLLYFWIEVVGCVSGIQGEGHGLERATFFLTKKDQSLLELRSLPLAYTDRG